MLLIIPAERKLDWRRPPWVTLALIAVNLLVFLTYQGEDRQKFAQALSDYLHSDLPRLETPLYPDYLQRRIQLREVGLQAKLRKVEQAVRKKRTDWLAAHMLADQGFYHYLQNSGSLYWSPAVFQQWREQREQIEHQDLDRLSSRAMGLTPAHIRLPNLISYQFLHGGWGHIVGNMIFLFLLGFTLELALGSLRYLAAYLLCGILSGLVFALFEWGSTQPLIGASGAISGLMGMYVAIFRLQRIRFFYWIGFFFSYFRAPALVVLPVWVGKEVLDYLAGGPDAHVAYMAHAGGLAAGALLIYLMRGNWMTVKETFFEPEEEDREAEFRKAYALALADLGRLEFRHAGLKLEALKRKYPRRLVLWEHLYQLARLRPDEPAYREQARALMSEALKAGQVARALAVWREFIKEGEGRHPLAAKDHARILFACLRQGELAEAERVFQHLRGAGDLLLTEEACRLLLQEMEKRQMTPKANTYRQLLEQLQNQPPAGAPVG